MKNTIHILGISLSLIWVMNAVATKPAKATPGITTSYDQWTDPNRARQIPVKYYLPAALDKATTPFPVVIFSHGLGGSREAAVYLGDYLCKHGYVGVFIQHPGSDESFWKPDLQKSGGAVDKAKILSKFKTQLMNPMHAVNRAKDVHFVVDMLEQANKSNPRLKGKLDLNKIAIAGHSFGSWTALTASGQSMVTPFGKEISSVEPRIKAAIYLSPTAPRKNTDPAVVFGKIQIPGLHLTGTADDSPVNDAKAIDRRIAFDNISKSDQYLVILNGADHMVFGGRARKVLKPEDMKHQEIVQETTLHFLDAYLKGDSDAKKWLKTQAQGYIKPYGTYEQKAIGLNSKSFRNSSHTL